ncbi:hypothetical protein [Austwickia chelonae]|uniref:hypothetical protein n=1 Tax=Austwickia chelonae TaxID=100225 RepID=UPI0013C30AE8|nr:hypothetical protein [Austwickia chelonae]
MTKTMLGVIGFMVTAPLAFVMFDGTETGTRAVVSVILGVGIGAAGALMFGRGSRPRAPRQ